MAKTKAEVTQSPDETRDYILNCKHGKTKKVTVPAHWKVTFGPMVPGSKYEQTPCLRFYESANLQRAIFTDVESFRDASIPIVERVTKKQTKTHTQKTPEGDRDVVVEARMTEWRDPDQDHDPDEEFLSLPPVSFE